MSAVKQAAFFCEVFVWAVLLLILGFVLLLSDRLQEQ
jgi:hypothetical protein